jgi:tungstate transport system substrate-binding protein
MTREPSTNSIAAGNGIDRRQIAWNHFIVVGPRSDPAHIACSRDAVAAVRVIANTRALFVSCRDRSGTDVVDRRLWREAGLDPSKGSRHGDIGGAVLFSSRVVIVKKTSFKSS